jgi:hypothetical protein
MNDEHVLAFVETVDRTDLDAVHVFAFDAIVGHDIGHRSAPGRPIFVGLFPSGNAFIDRLQG